MHRTAPGRWQRHKAQHAMHRLGASTTHCAKHLPPLYQGSHRSCMPAASAAGMCKLVRCRVRAAAITVQLPNCQPIFSFPHLGSGLLFARSTGLKVLLGGQPHVWQQVTQLRRGWADQQAGAAYAQVEQQGPLLQGCVVVELGAGLGLCSVAAALAGAQVIATDGDADLVRLLKKNMQHNWQRLGKAGEPAPQAALLPWGDQQAVMSLQHMLNIPSMVTHPSQPTANSGSITPDGIQDQPGIQAVDILLLADCVYGSNPGVWEKLVSTLKELCSPTTVVLQAESRRIEGVLYGEYWDMLCEAGFHCQELDIRQDTAAHDEQLDTAGHVDRLPAHGHSMGAATEWTQQLPSNIQPGHTTSPVRAWIIQLNSDARQRAWQ